MRNESDQITQDSLDADSFLCERCSKININEILSLQNISFRDGHHILDFRSKSEIVENPDCSFCQAFDFISPPNFVRQSHRPDSCSLIAIRIKDYDTPLSTSLKRDVLKEDCVFLTTNVLGSFIWRMGDAGKRPLKDFPDFPGCLGLPSGLKEKRDLFRADYIGSTVDFNMLGSWIKTCEREHGDYCAPSSTQKSTLRLIECNSRRVIATPKPPEVSTYAALSYVWGSQEPDEICSEELPKQLPKTIEDAITVTKGLGIPYIWIDRYCINQDDELEKNDQCSLMHMIYANAHVTIIAAAGSGPDHGLPGIGSSTRSYPSVRIGSHLLVPTLPDPKQSIRAAKWSSRGWTYQESKLSKRRLIFTDRQVLFVCRRACTDEAEQKLYPDAELPNGDIRPSTTLYPFCMSAKSPLEVWDDISQFSKLDLSHQEDCLNAMLGILQRYQESIWEGGLHLRHLAGLPVIIKGEVSNSQIPENHEDSIWTPWVLKSLAWGTGHVTKRRDGPYPGFPSWSWTAWKSTGYYAPATWRAYDSETFHWNKSFFVEYPDGDLVRGNELDSLLQAGHDFSRIRFIHLKAPSLNVTIFPFQHSSLADFWGYVNYKLRGDWHCVIRHHDTDFVCPVQMTDSSARIPEDGFRCWGIMVSEKMQGYRIDALFLLVTKVKDWYERIAVIEVHEPEVLQALETRTFRLG